MMGQEFKYAIRGLRRSPGFTLVAAFTLALGIGANTAIFSVVNGVLFRPLPYDDADQLTVVWENNLSRGWPRFTVSPANFQDWHRRADQFESMAAYTRGTRTVTGQGDPFDVPVSFVSEDFFRVLRQTPVTGRGFDSAEFTPGADGVAVVSHTFWQRVLGEDPAAVGSMLDLGGAPTEIVGVMPAGFDFRPRGGDAVDVWLPLTFNFDVSQARGAHYLTVVARVTDGQSVQTAQTSMEQLAANLEAAFPETNTGWSVVVVPLRDQILGASITRTILVIWAAVGLVLLIACVNVANLFLTRSSARGRELAVRVALGAGRIRVVRQFATEAALLTMAGAVAGVGIAAVGVQWLVAEAPRGIPRLDEIGVDGAALAFTVAIAAIVTLLVAFVPAIHGAGGAPADALRGVRGATSGRSVLKLRNTLVIAEVAIALVVVVGSGLLVRTFQALNGVDPGFDAESVLALDLAPPAARYADGSASDALYGRILETLDAHPAAVGVATVSPAPLSGDLRFSHSFVGEQVDASETRSALTRTIHGDYFDVMGISLLTGRAFDQRDRRGSAPVVIVNQAFVDRHSPNESILGRRLEIGSGDAACPCEVIGVAANVRHMRMTDEPEIGIYLPATQIATYRSMTVLVKTSGPPEQLAGVARRAVLAIDPLLPVNRLGPFAARVDASFKQSEFQMTLFAAFALVAMLLATVGIYGVMAYSVRQRVRDIGVRLALGATPPRLAADVVRQALALTAVGTLLGTIAALGLTRFLDTMLYGVAPRDPVTFVIVPLAILGVGALAGYLPARRVARVDPIGVLRDA